MGVADHPLAIDDVESALGETVGFPLGVVSTRDLALRVEISE